VEAPQTRNTHLRSAVLYMQFIRGFPPDLHYSLLRETIYKRYLVLAARVLYHCLYDVVNERKEMESPNS